MHEPDYKPCERCGEKFPRDPRLSQKRWAKVRFCSRRCSNRGRLFHPPHRPVRERFESKVDRSPGQGPNGDCHEWTASRFAKGYGSFGYERKTRYAHRVAWFLATGTWPESCVCHRCDNPPCVRIDHLFLGTYRDNARDMVAKGRYVPPGVRGEAHGCAKLTAEQAATIQSLRGVEPLRVTAHSFGVSRSTVSLIQRGKLWAGP